MQQLINHPQVHFKIQVALPVSYLLDIGDIVEISQAILTKPRFGLVMTQCKSPLIHQPTWLKILPYPPVALVKWQSRVNVSLQMN